MNSLSVKILLYWERWLYWWQSINNCDLEYNSIFFFKRKRDSGIEATQSLQDASAIIDEIAHTFSIKTIRVMAFALIKIIKQLFQNVMVNKEGVEQVFSILSYFHSLKMTFILT